MDNSEIKAIIFDLGGVLIDLNMPQCFENIQALGADLDAISKPSDNSNGNGATLCEGLTASGLMNQYQIGEVSTDEFINTIAELSKPGTTHQQIIDAWNSCLLSISEYKLDFIKELRAKGYAIYMLSNTNDCHWKYIEENSFPEPVSTYFDHCFLSQEMGMAKPNEDIYKSLLRQIPFSAGECLFLDDSKVNCTAAEALGINSINIPVKSDFCNDVKLYLQQHKLIKACCTNNNDK